MNQFLVNHNEKIQEQLKELMKSKQAQDISKNHLTNQTVSDKN